MSPAPNAQKTPHVLMIPAPRCWHQRNWSTKRYGDAFNFALRKIFTNRLLTSLTKKDTILMEVRDCFLTNTEERCIQIRPASNHFGGTYTSNQAARASTTRSQNPMLWRASIWASSAAPTPEIGEWPMWPSTPVGHINWDLLTKTAKCTPCRKDKNWDLLFPWVNAVL